MVYGEKERRNFLRLTMLSLTFTAGMILFMVLALIGIVVIPAVLDFLHLGAMGELLINILRWPAMLAVVVLGLAVIYRYGPCRADANGAGSPGAACCRAAVVHRVDAVLVVRENFGNYNKTYGSLGAAIAFMMWSWISTTIVLMGGELNAEIEHQTAKDSTTGPPKPLGARGARMADTVGAAKD